MCQDSSVLRIWRTLANHLGIFKVNRVIWRPSVFSDVGTSCVRHHIPHMFFFSRFKASASLAYITPWAVNTRYFILNYIWLKFNQRLRFLQKELGFTQHKMGSHGASNQPNCMLDWTGWWKWTAQPFPMKKSWKIILKGFQVSRGRSLTNLTPMTYKFWLPWVSI